MKGIIFAVIVYAFIFLCGKVGYYLVETTGYSWLFMTTFILMFGGIYPLIKTVVFIEEKYKL